mmetsp:Transcript_10748/g.28291  ORF Transcript_10748/g.28291 Transcript_10748/m.28291 type:complete len:157 (-) Transcript_10748:388-858(-)
MRPKIPPSLLPAPSSLASRLMSPKLSASSQFHDHFVCLEAVLDTERNQFVRIENLQDSTVDIELDHVFSARRVVVHLHVLRDLRGGPVSQRHRAKFGDEAGGIVEAMFGVSVSVEQSESFLEIAVDLASQEGAVVAKRPGKHQKAAFESHGDSYDV